MKPKKLKLQRYTTKTKYDAVIDASQQNSETVKST